MTCRAESSCRPHLVTVEIHDVWSWGTGQNWVTVGEERLSEDCAGLLTSKPCKPRCFLYGISLCDPCGLGFMFSACAAWLVVTKKPLISILCQPSTGAGSEKGAVALCRRVKFCGMTCAVRLIHVAFGNTLSCRNEQNEQCKGHWRGVFNAFSCQYLPAQPGLGTGWLCSFSLSVH